MALHKNLAGSELHGIHAFTYADANARLTATDFVSADIGKVALQSDNSSFWVLTATTPTWLELTGLTSADITNYITVGKDGPVRFNTIKEAVQQAVADGASVTNPITVAVYPGTYTEDNPITIPLGVSVSSISGERESSLIVEPSTPTDDLFIMDGGSLLGCALSGVTDPLKACIRASTSAVISNVQACSITNCSNGLIVENGAIVDLTNFVANVTVADSAIDTAIYVDGSNSKLIVKSSIFYVTESILSSYIDNPIRLGIHADNGCIVDILNSNFQLLANDTDQITILLDNDSTTVRILGCNFDGGNLAAKISSSGSNAIIDVQSTTIYNYTTNVQIDSSTGALFGQISTDAITGVAVPGATITGIRAVTSDKSTDLTGTFHYAFSASRQTPISSFIRDKSSTGLKSGGEVTASTGLVVNISDGYGWVHRVTEQDVRDVSWDATVLPLEPNETNYVFYNGQSLIIDSNTSGISPSNIQLAVVYTDGTDVRFIHNTSNIVVDTDALLHEYLLATRKFRLNSGLAASQGSGPTKITIDGGSYYITSTLIDFAGSADAGFSYFYDNGNVEFVSPDIDTVHYDDGGGILAIMTDGYYRTDTIYLTSDGRISVIFGTDEFDTAAGAEEAPKATAPIFIEPSGLSIANVIVQKNIGIIAFIDLRPTDSSSSGGTSAGVTDHGLLSGLLDDDHPIYVLASGSRSMSGDLDMGGNNITNVNFVDGTDVSAHASRHNPGQIDALATAVPVIVLAGASLNEGSAASYARSDHQHGIGTATPVSVSSANDAGSASTVSRSDHVHAHGSLGGGSTHALAIAAGAAGYISGTDKSKLDGIASGATNTPLTAVAPVNTTKAAASVGVSTEAARADHKHDITTATAIGIGIANSEGSASSLSRSDHVHRGTLIQSVFAEVASDISTVSLTFTDLISQSIITTGGDLVMQFTTGCSNTNNNQQVIFRITVDGVVKRGVGTVASAGANNIESASIILKVTGLSTGAHTVKVQWRVTANTGQIRPVSAPDTEHASLLISEVTV